MPTDFEDAAEARTGWRWGDQRGAEVSCAIRQAENGLLSKPIPSDPPTIAVCRAKERQRRCSCRELRRA